MMKICILELNKFNKVKSAMKVDDVAFANDATFLRS